MGVRGEMVRTVQSIQIGTALDIQKRADQDLELDMQEIDLQYQLPVSGTAGDASEWETVELDFEWEFFYAPSNRDSDLAYPHMTYGAYVPGVPVALFACVNVWKVDTDTDAITGVVLAVTALGNQVDFAGSLHLNFQGYALSRDDFSDSSDLETGVDT